MRGVVGDGGALVITGADIALWVGVHGVFLGLLLVRSIVGRFTGV